MIVKMITPSKTYVNVEIETDEDYHYLSGGFSLKNEFKSMEGARWLGFDKDNPRKVWRVANCRHNNVNLDYLQGKRPFARYTINLDQVCPNENIRTSRMDMHGKSINIYPHQLDMIKHILVRKQCILAADMGTGKTLAAFEAMELALVPQVWYVAPKSAIVAVRLEAQKWRLLCNTRYMTYDELKKVLAGWTKGDAPPKFVVFDESSKIKTQSSQRSQAAFHLAESMRDHWRDQCYIVLMSGSPAPKSPLD